MQPAVLERGDLPRLLDALKRTGARIIGPTVKDGAIVYDEIERIEDFPVGWTDEQAGGTSRLKKRYDQALFGYVVGPHSWKQFLHPPILKLWQATRDAHGVQCVPESTPVPKYAFIGVRPCELAAIAIHDRVFLEGQYVDPAYKARREQLFIVAVNCGQAGGTCFCASMNTGPKATCGFDLALTEILEGERHYFLVEIGTVAGEAVLRDVPHRAATEAEQQVADHIVSETATHMGRTMDTTEIKALLYRNMDHPRWDHVANRCLTCGNCTMVCPTCFCTTVTDATDLRGDRAQRVRTWDSCFTMGFSHIHGGPIRASAKSRYRQWMTHKLATWIDQFGTSGCVGCGRCITWCPVGIDLTEEVTAIRATDSAGVTALT